jgi:hypothetical protein
VDLTVGDLRQQLKGLKDDDRLTFAGGLTFYRLKRVADDEYFFEFNEAEGYLTSSVKKRNPDVKVVFLDAAKATNWNEEGTIGHMDVEVR